MIRRPPRSTQSRSSAASDVYKRQVATAVAEFGGIDVLVNNAGVAQKVRADILDTTMAVSYTHLRAHETPEHLVCRLLLEKKKYQRTNIYHHKQLER